MFLHYRTLTWRDMFGSLHFCVEYFVRESTSLPDPVGDVLVPVGLSAVLLSASPLNISS